MTMRHRIMPATLAAALTVLIATPAHAAERQYVKTDLGTLGGAATTAAALNEAGVVVGTSGDHAFRWQNGRLTDLGALAGGTSSAVGVNESGVVAGTSTDALGRNHAVIWRGTRIVDLGLGTAAGINDRGQVIGERTATVGTRRLVRRGGALADLGGTTTGTRRMLWQNGLAIDLGPVPAGTYAFGINNRGDIIGTFPEPPGQPCGCTSSAGINHHGQVTTFGSFATPSLNDPASRPFGYNNNGDVVGWATIDDGLVRPFRWHDGTLTQLPNLGGYEGVAFGVNDYGLAVGTGDQPRPPANVPVTWTGSVLNDLTDQGFDPYGIPVGVNNRGQIITNYYGGGRAYFYR